jgi:integrase
MPQAPENLNTGMPIEDLAMLLGHPSTRTTERHYMPWNKNRQQRLDAAVDKALAAHDIVEAQAPAGLHVQ